MLATRQRDFRGKLIDFQKRLQFQKRRVYRVFVVSYSLRDFERYYQQGRCYLFKYTEKEDFFGWGFLVCFCCLFVFYLVGFCLFFLVWFVF